MIQFRYGKTDSEESESEIELFFSILLGSKMFCYFILLSEPMNLNRIGIVLREQSLQSIKFQEFEYILFFIVLFGFHQGKLLGLFLDDFLGNASYFSDCVSFFNVIIEEIIFVYWKNCNGKEVMCVIIF